MRSLGIRFVAETFLYVLSVWSAPMAYFSVICPCLYAFGLPFWFKYLLCLFAARMVFVPAGWLTTADDTASTR